MDQDELQGRSEKSSATVPTMGEGSSSRFTLFSVVSGVDKSVDDAVGMIWSSGSGVGSAVEQDDVANNIAKRNISLVFMGIFFSRFYFEYDESIILDG